jgi:hypothetical protein
MVNVLVHGHLVEKLTDLVIDIIVVPIVLWGNLLALFQEIPTRLQQYQLIIDQHLKNLPI